MKAKDIQPGIVFKYADSKGDGLFQQTQFIKLLHNDYNVVNVANWTAAHVDDDADVVVLGSLKLIKGK